jgi:hypothetical protein
MMIAFAEAPAIASFATGQAKAMIDPELRRYVAMVDEQITLWKRDKITAQEAWYSLTYERREFANWAMVEDFCIGWLQGQRRRGRPVPVENVA